MSKKKSKKPKKHRCRRSQIPSSQRLEAETERFEQAKSPEEILEIRENIRVLQQQVRKETEELKTKIEGQAGNIKQRLMMRRTMPVPLERYATEQVYCCPKCEKKWLKSELNKSNRKPWCPHCNIRIYSLSDKRFKRKQRGYKRSSEVKIVEKYAMKGGLTMRGIGGL